MDKKNETQSGQCCVCPKSKEEERNEEEERMFQIEFENYLHNVVYVKRYVPPLYAFIFVFFWSVNVCSVYF